MDINRLEQLCEQILAQFQSADDAHKLDHLLRVVKQAKQLALEENADLDVVIAAAYLHDLVSLRKNHPERHLASSYAAKAACEALAQSEFPKHKLDAVFHAIAAHSYSAKIEATSLEAKIVQDADRMDALGAIGIARCIQVGSALGRDLYSSVDPFCDSRSPDDLSFTLDHFYVKLLAIPETMHTESGKRIASTRRDFMLSYLTQLANEI